MSDTGQHESKHSTVRESAASRSQDVESQHARAPWGVKEWNSEGFPLVVIDGGQALVASIWPNGSQEATEANARLIAAAPDLLAALLAFRQGIADGSIKWTTPRQADGDPYHPANVLMWAAIAKAEGQD